MIAAFVTQQLLFNGVATGLVIGLIAMGIVLVYRATRVINFAVGNMGLVGSSLLALLVINYGVSFWVALPVALLVGMVFGAAVELIVVRRLFRAPRVILLVATVGVAQLAQAIIRSYPDVEGAGSRYPVGISGHWTLFGLRISGAQLAIVLVVPVVAIVLAFALNHTAFGKSVAASADNPELARLSGVNPKLVSTFVWVIAGLLSTLSMVLLSGQVGTIAGLENLGPITLARALVAAVLAGMVSFWRAVVAGVVIGIVEAVLRFNVLDQPGLIDFALFVVVLAAVMTKRRNTRATDEVFAFAPKVAPVPERLRELWWVRHLSHIVLAVAVAAAIALPLLEPLPSRHLLYSTVLCFAICAASVVVITGWSGQLSLSQMTFAGGGALGAAALQRGVEIDVWILDGQAAPLPFAVSIVVSSLGVAAIAAIVGLGGLRTRGLMLAVTTFTLALAASQYLFQAPVLSDGNSVTVPFRRGEVFGVNLESQRTYYYSCLVALVLVIAMLSRLRRTGIGRVTIAVRDNPTSAAAYTVPESTTRLRAFSLAGGVAALGGALLAGAIQSVPFGERFFLVDDSLRVVGMAVIGGIGSVIGAVVGAVWVVGLPAFFPDNELVPLFTSSIGLLAIVMYFPGGFIEIFYGARSAVFRWAERRHPELSMPAPRPSTPAVISRRNDGATPEVTLRASGVSVRFGGVLAVNDVTIEVRRDEVVGLIGTNGAGKTTLMDAFGGYVPSSGRFDLLGVDVTELSASKRAALGLGRTFQAARLFPELTVRETVQVALEGRRPTSLLATASFTRRSSGAERQRRSDAEEIIGFLGLGRYADSFISEMSTGTRRIIELAGLLALDARVLCLDEPTAGLAQREAEALVTMLTTLRAEMGASMVIIEHDMPLIMSMSDRVYCLESGSVISEGIPATVRNDPAVIASYLGTDVRAFARSDL